MKAIMVDKNNPQNPNEMDFTRFIQNNALFVKNFLENVDAYLINFTNYSSPASKVVFYVDEKKIELDKPEINWHIDDYQRISFKFEDYNKDEDPLNFVVIKNEAIGSIVLNAENPMLKLPAIDGGGSYGSFEIIEVANPNAVYKQLTINTIGKGRDYQLYGMLIETIEGMTMIRDNERAGFVIDGSKPIRLAFNATYIDGCILREKKTGKQVGVIKNNEVEFTSDETEFEITPPDLKV